MSPTTSLRIARPKLAAMAEIKAQLEGVLILQTYSAVDIGAAPVSNDNLDQLPASFGQFNLGLHVGDDPQKVHDHRCQLLAAINTHLAECDPHNASVIERLHWVNQVHGNTVMRVDSLSLDMQATDADAMVSSTPRSGLAIMTADCVPIVLYQPSSQQIAAIHAGWQGLASGVIKAAADTFEACGEIIAWIGACISQSNYEVGAEVVDKLVAGCEQHKLLPHIAPGTLKDMICRSSAGVDENSALDASDGDNHEDKYWVDLPKLATMQLAAQGIQIADSNDIPCSYAERRYYSYRRQTHEQRPATGRMALVILKV